MFALGFCHGKTMFTLILIPNPTLVLFSNLLQFLAQFKENFEGYPRKATVSASFSAVVVFFCRHSTEGKVSAFHAIGGRGEVEHFYRIDTQIRKEL
jgi:hypothetical protein